MKLAIRKSEVLSDWYLIERAEHDGREEWRPAPDGFSLALWRSSRISDADVEGPLFEMRAIAAGIRKREDVSFRRCAVRFVGDLALFWSPRNSSEEGKVSLAEADGLAAQIEALEDKL